MVKKPLTCRYIDNVTNNIIHGTQPIKSQRAGTSLMTISAWSDVEFLTCRIMKV